MSEEERPDSEPRSIERVDWYEREEAVQRAQREAASETPGEQTTRPPKLSPCLTMQIDGTPYVILAPGPLFTAEGVAHVITHDGPKPMTEPVTLGAFSVASHADWPDGWTEEQVQQVRGHLETFGFTPEAVTLLLFRDAYRRGIFDGYHYGYQQAWAQAEAARETLKPEESSKLTNMQRRIVGMVAYGEQLPGIAAQFGISEEGVRYHLKEAAKALGLPGVRELRKMIAERKNHR